MYSARPGENEDKELPTYAHPQSFFRARTYAHGIVGDGLINRLPPLFECDYRPAGSRARQTNRPSLAKPQICDGHHSAGTAATIELGLPAQLDQRRPQ